jgi:hypothetical protein
MVTKSTKAKSSGKKTTSKSSKSTSGSGPDSRGYDGYVRLRTMIDSLECGSIRYYLQGANPAERRARLKKLETDLMPIVDWLWHQTGAVKRTARVASFAADDVICPEGYVNCHGCCVPNQCPDKQG